MSVSTKSLLIGTVVGLLLSVSAMAWVPEHVARWTGYAPLKVEVVFQLLEELETLEAAAESCQKGMRGI